MSVEMLTATVFGKAIDGIINEIKNKKFIFPSYKQMKTNIGNAVTTSKKLDLKKPSIIITSHLKEEARIFSISAIVSESFKTNGELLIEIDKGELISSSVGNFSLTNQILIDFMPFGYFIEKDAEIKFYLRNDDGVTEVSINVDVTIGFLD